MIYRGNREEYKLIFCAICVLAFGVILFGTLYNSSKEASAEVKDEAKMPAVPILMYHSVCENKMVNSDYCVSPKVFEADMKYLYKNGYKTVFVSDLVAYVYEGIPLPEKPIIVTLDDGYLNNFTEVLPVLEKYDMCATISVVGEFIRAAEKENDPNPLYAYLTSEDIKQLDDTGRIEIGNHTDSMHSIGERRGCMKIKNESDDRYDKALSKDLAELQNMLTEKANLTPIVFTYPYGFVSEESLPVIKKLGFLAALTCYERINYINGTPEQLYRLGRFNRVPGISTEAFMKKSGI